MSLSKENLNYNNMYVIVCPELVAASIKKKEGDLYIIWLILKLIDKTHSNSGHMDVRYMQGVIRKFLELGQSQLYTKIQQGVGKYWAKPNGKKNERTTSLYSREKVISYLEPTMIKVKPFKVRLRDFVINDEAEQKQYLHDLLISLVVGSRENLHPLSYASICEHLGVSKRTVQRAVNNCSEIIKYQNSVEIYSHANYDIVREKLYSYMETTGKHMWQIGKQNNSFKLLQQIPNSYLVSFDRLPCRYRPKELKSFDEINFANASTKKYLDETTKSLSDGEKYIASGIVKEENIPIFTWKIVEQTRQLSV